MTKIRRGGYIFITWKSDNPPYHVHVYRDSHLVLEWDLEHDCAMMGQPSALLLELIKELREDGRL